MITKATHIELILDLTSTYLEAINRITGYCVIKIILSSYVILLLKKSVFKTFHQEK